MQVASTLWPDIKSQKISKHRFRLKWTEPTRRRLGAVGAMGWPADHPGRPTRVVGRQPRGANRPQLHPAGCPRPPCPNPVGLGLS